MKGPKIKSCWRVRNIKHGEKSAKINLINYSCDHYQNLELCRFFSLQKLEVFEFALGTIQQHVHDNGRIRIEIQEESILNKSWLIGENYKAD